MVFRSFGTNNYCNYLLQSPGHVYHHIGGRGIEDTHPWSATKVGNPISATRDVQQSDIMDLRHQSSAMCIIMLGGEDTHPWSATKVGDPIPATIQVTKKNNQQTTQSSHYAVDR